MAFLARGVGVMQVLGRLVGRLARGMRDVLVRTSRHPAPHAAWTLAYRLAARPLGALIAGVPGVRAVYLTHGLALGECHPGLSDYDLVVVFETPDRLAFYQRMRRRWHAARRALPVEDLRLVSRAEFDLWLAVGGGTDPRDEIAHWQLVAGRELRPARIETSGPQADLDRAALALANFQNLMQVVLKEEPRSPHFTLFARRQLDKSFWYAMLALDARYLALPTLRKRVAAWRSEHADSGVVSGLDAMRASRFAAGPVTPLRFAAAALAYRAITDRFTAWPRLRAPLAAPALVEHPNPVPASTAEVVQRVEPIVEGLVGVCGAEIASITVTSPGSPRGYACHVALRDDLDEPTVARVLRDLRAVFRVFDTPWFNEHFPAGLPVVESCAMFRARLEAGRSTSQGMRRHRIVMYGRDLVAEAFASAEPLAAATDADDLARERLVYSMNLNQVYLRRLKPTLHDFVTLYYPRLALQAAGAPAPASVEEAVVRMDPRAGADPLPRRFLERYGAMDLDAIHRAIRPESFDEAWPLLRGALVGAEAAA
jgi:hypothetical protein